MIALATALRNIKIFTLLQGGSITLGAMIPILLFSLRRGFKLGVISGAVFGLIALYPSPIVVHPIQLLLDYPLAYGSLGLAGLFKRYPTAGIAVGIFGRFISHFTAGYIFFATFAPEGMHPAIYSMIYNGSYLGIELLISTALIYMLLKRGILEIYR